MWRIKWSLVVRIPVQWPHLGTRCRPRSVSNIAIRNCASGRLFSTDTITEIKQRLNGSCEKFELELYDLNEKFIVAKWTAQKHLADKYGIAVGSYSWGVWPLYEQRGCWGAYRYHRPDGTLQKYRFDCVEKTYVTRKGKNSSEFVFHDLILDAWVDLDMSVKLEDEDELEEAIRRNELTEAQKATVAEFKRLLTQETSWITHVCDQAIAEAVKSKQNKSDESNE